MNEQQQKAITPYDAKRGELSGALDRMKKEFEKVLPKIISSERFARFALTHWATTKELIDVDIKSYVGAVMECAQLGFLPGKARGHVALIPYRNKEGQSIVTVVPMYRGLLKLVLDAGRYIDIQCEIIYANDDFHFQRGDKPFITHQWKLGIDRGVPVGGYTIFTEDNGRTHFDVVDWPYILAIKKRATASRRSSPWDTDEIEMARKTCLRHAVKYVAMGEDTEARDRFERAVELDNDTFTVEAVPAEDSHPIPAHAAAAKTAAKMEALKAKPTAPVPTILTHEQLAELEAAKAKVEAAREAALADAIAKSEAANPKLYTCSIPGCPGRAWPAPHNCGTPAERCENPMVSPTPPPDAEPPADMLLPGQEGYEEQEERAAMQEQPAPANQAPVWTAPERQTRRKRGGQNENSGGLL